MRKVGIAAIKRKGKQQAAYANLGAKLEVEKLSIEKETLLSFKDCLSDFASKHKNEINNDPEFRQQFHVLCLSVGVDPLASNKGFWSDILGVGDFYFELGVKIIQICN